MHFICPRENLSAALGYASQAVSSRAAVDVLKGLLLVCTEDTLTITGFDLELAITVRLDADVIAQGAAVLDAKVICEMVRRANGENLRIQADERGLTRVECEAFQSEITSLPADSYPSLPEVETQRSFTYPQAVLRRQLSRVLFSAAAPTSADNKHIHTGVLFESMPELLRLVALDGHRLAICDAPLTSEDGGEPAAVPDEEAVLRFFDPADCFRFVIPGNALHKLERLLEEDEEALVSFRIGARGALITLGNITISPRLLEGDFFNYRRSVPRSPAFSAVLPTRLCIQALERVGLMVVDKLKNPIRLSLSEDMLRISCRTAIGSSKDDLFCQNGPAEPLDIGFNHHYLLDALRRINTDTFRFQGSGASSPCLILPSEGENPLYMVLPIRLPAPA